MFSENDRKVKTIELCNSKLQTGALSPAIKLIHMNKLKTRCKQQLVNGILFVHLVFIKHGTYLSGTHSFSIEWHSCYKIGQDLFQTMNLNTQYLYYVWFNFKNKIYPIWETIMYSSNLLCIFVLRSCVVNKWTKAVKASFSFHIRIRSILYQFCDL